MSNDVIWNALRSKQFDRHRARLVLLVMASAIAVLCTQVPTPAEIAEFVARDLSETGDGSISDQIGQALLMLAGLAIWLLVGWIAAILVFIGLSAISPGPISGRAALLASRLAPRVARQLLLTAVGVGTIAGLTACAPAGQPTGAPVGLESRGQTSSVTKATDLDTGTDITTSWNLDWPVAESTTPAATISEPSTPEAGATSIDLDVAVATSESLSTQANNTPSDVPAPAPDSGSSNGEDPAVAGAPDDLEAMDLDWPAGADSDQPGQASTPQTDSGVTPVPSAVPSAVPSTTPGQAPDTGLSSVTVGAGDNLWSIAARQLPPTSSLADIDTAWRAWYAANRAAIGDNPDQLAIGIVLNPPVL